MCPDNFYVLSFPAYTGGHDTKPNPNPRWRPFTKAVFNKSLYASLSESMQEWASKTLSRCTMISIRLTFLLFGTLNFRPAEPQGEGSQHCIIKSVHHRDKVPWSNYWASGPVGGSYISPSELEAPATDSLHLLQGWIIHRQQLLHCCDPFLTSSLLWVREFLCHLRQYIWLPWSVHTANLPVLKFQCNMKLTQFRVILTLTK